MSEAVLFANNDDEIESCFGVMAQLRPHIQREEFLPRVKRQAETFGYKLAYLAADEIKAVTGFRISECLAWGKFLWVDDLVTKNEDRNKGYGGKLFDWLVDYAQRIGCGQIHLDSRVQRFAAHRFYLNKRMIIECHHFSLELEAIDETPVLDIKPVLPLQPDS